MDQEEKRQANARRKAKFRKRQQTAGENGRRKIEAWVSTHSALTLKRLARHKGLAQGDLLELLLRAADEAVTAEMTDEEHGRYLDT